MKPIATIEWRTRDQIGNSGYPPREGWWWTFEYGTDVQTSWATSFDDAAISVAVAYRQLMASSVRTKQQ